MARGTLKTGQGAARPGTPSAGPAGPRGLSRRPRRRSAIRPGLLLSLLLHVAAVLALVLLSEPPPRPPDVAEPGTVMSYYEGTSNYVSTGPAIVFAGNRALCLEFINARFAAFEQSQPG